MVDIEEVTVEKGREETVEVIMPVEKQPEDVAIEITLMPPEFVEPILSLEVVEGDKAVFEAHVIGSQPIEITWYHSQELLQVGNIELFSCNILSYAN